MSDPINYTDQLTCTLLDSQASDLAVVNAARISLDTQHPDMEEGDAPLIRFLLRNRHGTPFEHGYFKFLVEAPIFVFREHHRHRAGHSYNEMSGRYTQLEPKFYVPNEARVQQGKPGAYVYEDEPALTKPVQRHVQRSYEIAWATYEDLLRMGVAKEQARVVLPVGIYTKMIWSCNPRSLMHFLGLRNAPTAQAEIRAIAQQAETALRRIMPITWAAFIEAGRVAP